MTCPLCHDPKSPDKDAKKLAAIVHHLGGQVSYVGLVDPTDEAAVAPVPALYQNGKRLGSLSEVQEACLTAIHNNVLGIPAAHIIH